jgi:hypothetical protein
LIIKPKLFRHSRAIDNVSVSHHLDSLTQSINASRKVHAISVSRLFYAMCTSNTDLSYGDRSRSRCFYKFTSSFKDFNILTSYCISPIQLIPIVVTRSHDSKPREFRA